jgi:hypothetical protein
MKPQGNNNKQVLSILCNAVCGRGIERQKVSHGGKYSDMVVQTVKKLRDVIPVTMLALLFNIIFSQTLMTIPAQGIVMAKSGFVILSGYRTLTRCFQKSCILIWRNKRGTSNYHPSM